MISERSRKRGRAAVIAAVAAGVAFAGPSVASEPASGTVSRSQPSVSWTGEAETAPFARQMRDEQYRRCGPAICDTFALTVADPGELTVQVKGEERGVALQVIAPDGTKTFTDNFDGDPTQPATIIIQGAKPGDYAIEIWQDASELDAHQLSGSARLAPPPQPAAAPPTTPPAPESPPSAPSPSPAQPVQPASRVTIRTTRVRSRKTARRRLVLQVTASAAVTDVKAQILRNRKVVGRGGIASLNGNGKIVVRTRRALRPGRYVVGLSATDASGARIAVSRTLTVRR